MVGKFVINQSDDVTLRERGLTPPGKEMGQSTPGEIVNLSQNYKLDKGHAQLLK